MHKILMIQDTAYLKSREICDNEKSIIQNPPIAYIRTHVSLLVLN